MIKRRPWGHLALLIIILWLGVWLRLHNAEAFGFWTDEGLTPLRSSYSILTILSNKIFIQEAISTDTHPPLYYLLVHFTRQLFGESDFAYRFPSLLAGVLLIPLLYQFGRRLHNGRLGLIVALVTAVNPLQIWYANEARMYTLLVLLTAIATYALWRALQLTRQTRTNEAGLSVTRYLVIYIIFAGLAFYTHYTTAILIAAQGLFWLWILWQHGHKKLIAATIGLGLLLAIPLIPYTLPRLFTGAEANYFYVQPLVMLQDVVRFFHLGRSVDFMAPLIIAFNAGALALLLLGLYAAGDNLKRAFLLVYLLAVMAGLMAGSLLKPMYQGVRHIMIGSPAFMLLLSLGLTSALEHIRFRTPTERPRRRNWLWTAVSLGAALIIFGGSWLAIDNLFNDTRFGKDDFRQMIRFIEAQAGSNDVVVYNDATLLPVAYHYQTRDDLDVTAAPTYPYLARMVAEAQLETLAAAYDRVWFVTSPPGDGRDREKIVRTWLADNLTVVDSFRFPAHTVEVSTIAYTTAPDITQVLPDTAVPLDLNWSDLPRLAAVSLPPGPLTAGETLWFSLFWQGERPDEPVALRFNLQDEAGQAWWAIAEQPLLPGSSAWPNSDWVRRFYQLPVPEGTPPGEYSLTVQPVAPADGSQLGEAQAMASLTILPGTLDSGSDATAALMFANGLAIQRIETPVPDVRPGHTLPLDIYWQIGAESPDGIGYELTVRDDQGHLLRSQTGTVGVDWLETLPTNSLLRERTGLYIHPDTEPGTYRLEWRLLDGAEIIPGRPDWRPWSTESVALGEIEVIPWPLVTTAPTAVTRTDARFGPAISLYGFAAATGGDHLDVALAWQTEAPPLANSTTFLHLINESGEIVSQLDGIPVNGLRPTRGWRPAEFIIDPYTMTVPPDLPSGDYSLWVGLYDPGTGVRLPVTIGEEAQPDGRYLLTTISFD